MIKLILLSKFKRSLKKIQVQDGFTLVEIIIAIFILSIVAGLVIHSSIMAVNTSKINRAKTTALAIVNQEIEKIRAMDYEDIGIIASDPEGILESQITTEGGYRIYYRIAWADQDENYKKVAVTGYKEPMVEEVKVITMVFPTFKASQDQSSTLYPAPSDLMLSPIDGTSNIVLNWNSPDTTLTITGYSIYRNYSLLGNSLNNSYIDNPDPEIPYTYYVTATYEDNTESGPSNEVSIGSEPINYLPPENLQLVSDTDPSSNLIIYLEWEAPAISLTVSEYRIYRDNIFLASTTDNIFTDYPENNQTYSYYVTAVYENGEESGPSETQSN